CSPMLTDIACKAAACPADKARARFSDGAGLYLEVAKTGFKRWFWKFYFCGKEKRLALGGYPEIRLKDARIARDDARKLLRQGTDPMEWAWVNLDAAMITIPSLAMKRNKVGKINGRPHLVPLAPQAIACLLRLRVLTGKGRYVFPSLLSSEKPMSDNTVNTALRRMGYSNNEMTAHGFRAMARTILGEHLEVNPEVIEAQLAHGKSGPLGSAYDRTTYMSQRRKMMSEWADYLDQLREGADVLPFRPMATAAA
ncbi:MAG: site-specific integrase, partial [Burkholderiaceae bacterium]